MKQRVILFQRHQVEGNSWISFLFRKLDHPFNVKFYGAAQIREEDQLRVTFVMELCKENLMGRIFQNQDYIPVHNTWCREKCNSMGERHRQCSRVHTQSGHRSQIF